MAIAEARPKQALDRAYGEVRSAVKAASRSMTIACRVPWPAWSLRAMHQADLARYLNLAGLLLGFVGTIAMVRFSFYLQRFEGSV